MFATLFERGGDGRCYSSCALISPAGELVPGRIVGGGELACARKMHITKIDAGQTRSDERHWFTPGQGFVTFDTEHGAFGCLICYDRSFPEAWRTVVRGGATVVFVPVTSYGFREALFIAELQTRAAENGVFVAAANRVGLERVDFEVTMFGNSCVIDPTGEVLVRGASGAQDRGSETLVAEIDLAEVEATRKRIPYLADRRPDAYAMW